jgi:osmotically-inducible protein OsmY
MQRAGHKRPASARAAPAPRSASAGNIIAVAGSPIGDEFRPRAKSRAKIRSKEADERVASNLALEIAIRQRIETRLQGRVRNLRVRVSDDVVILEGQCATYYTKQLAQHAAMGIIEDEQLENAIVVNVQ